VKTFIKKIFLTHWERKTISAIVALIVWLVVNHSQVTTKMFDNVAIRVLNLPPSMTVEGIQSNHVLSQRVPITVSGHKVLLQDLTANDLEIVVDAADKSGQLQVTTSRSNLFCLNPDIDLKKAVSRVNPYRFVIELTKLLTEKIPIVVTEPVGEVPRDYQYLDIWPYHLYITVRGPEETVKQLKAKGLTLTFNMSNIKRQELETIQSSQAPQGHKSDAISFPVPEDWKKVSIPKLSDRPLEIDDPQAKFLCIDFVRSELHPIGKEVPVSLFFPSQFSATLNPQTYRLALGGLVEQFNGIYTLRRSLYAKGVSNLFVELVRNMLEISVVMAPKSEQRLLDWSIQFINPRLLEDRFVSILLSDNLNNDSLPLRQREEYLRNRFRNYMNRFQLYKSAEEKLDLEIELKETAVHIQETP